MFDNFLNPRYTLSLASLLRSSTQWRIAHVQLSSAMRSFGVSSLSKDVQEMNVAVKFIKEHLLAANSSPISKIVLMGHSTGTQDLLSYASLSTRTTGDLASREKVDGLILQAAVSDREGATPSGPDVSPERRAAWDKCLNFAKQTPDTEKRSTVMPMHLTTQFFGPVPLSVERFWSLASPGSPAQPGEDDLFSSDATDERLQQTWGVAVGPDNNEKATGVLRPLPESDKKEILVLQSGSDEHVPAHVDIPALLERWRKAASEAGGALHGQSKVIEGAIHDIGGEDSVSVQAREVVMRRSVVDYLADVLGPRVEDNVGEVLREAERKAEALRKQEEQREEGGEATTSKI